MIVVHFYVKKEGFGATVSKTVRPMLSDRCLSVLSCLSVTFVHRGQTVGRIKMKPGMQVGLGPGHIVLDGDPAAPPPKGHSPHPIFGPYLLRPNGCMHQDATWYGGRPQPSSGVTEGQKGAAVTRGCAVTGAQNSLTKNILWLTTTKVSLT